MNNIGKTNLWIWVIVVIALVIGYFFINGGSMEVGNTPTADEGGWTLRLWDADGNEIIVPSSFSAFSIWTTESPITCTIDSDCPGASTCWDNECVFRNVASMALGFGVTSQSADISYSNLHISAATPTEWSSALPTTSRTLAPGATEVFTSSAFNIPSAWEGASGTTFSVTVKGTNDYNGNIISDTKSITYQFYDDPTGGFTVNINNPFT